MTPGIAITAMVIGITIEIVCHWWVVPFLAELFN